MTRLGAKNLEPGPEKYERMMAQSHEIESTRLLSCILLGSRNAI